MAAVASQARVPGSSPLLSIGQVLAKLNPEFPDLTPSKLRFLEERQLVAPARTESGYRKFSVTDMDRLRFVLTMQRDHYLPLKVIRGYLAEMDAADLVVDASTPGVSIDVVRAAIERGLNVLVGTSGAVGRRAGVATT